MEPDEAKEKEFIFHVPASEYLALCRLQTTAYACCSVALDGMQPPPEEAGLKVLLKTIKESVNAVYAVKKQQAANK